MSDLEFSDSEDEQSNNNNQLFHKATVHVQHIHQQICQADLLQLYAYYKQATVGHCNTSKPGMFQMQARAKWQAWQALQNMSKEQAKEQYVKKVQQLDAVWYERNLNELQNATKVGWVVHSTLQQNKEEEEEKDNSCKNAFDWVRAGNLERLKSYIALHHASQQELLQQLDEHGMGLVHWAADRNNAKLLKYLLDCGAHIDLRDAEQQTPLHYAVTCAHRECLELLLEHGADCKACDADGQSCVDVAEDAEIRLLLEKYI